VVHFPYATTFVVLFPFYMLYVMLFCFCHAWIISFVLFVGPFHFSLSHIFGFSILVIHHTWYFLFHEFVPFVMTINSCQLISIKKRRRVRARPNRIKISNYDERSKENIKEDQRMREK